MIDRLLVRTFYAVAAIAVVCVLLLMFQLLGFITQPTQAPSGSNSSVAPVFTRAAECCDVPPPDGFAQCWYARADGICYAADRP